MIGISVGDANGVGPEILLRAYKAGEITEDFIAVGDFSVLNYCNNLMKLDIPLNKIKELNGFRKNYFNIYDLDLLLEDDISIGQLSEKTGFAALKYVEVATQLVTDPRVGFLVSSVVRPLAGCCARNWHREHAVRSNTAGLPR